MTIVDDSSSAERALMVSSDGHATAQMRSALYLDGIAGFDALGGSTSKA
jgi:hypothetical protein